MLRLLLCCFLCCSLSAGVFPVADMGLKLAFHLESEDQSHSSKQQCFCFYPNTAFQGGDVTISESSTEVMAVNGDLFVNIRFHSEKPGSVSSCLHIAENVQRNRNNYSSECSSTVEDFWRWESISSSGGGMPMKHTLRAKDVADILEQRDPREEVWEICAGRYSSSSSSTVSGLITLFQQTLVPDELVASMPTNVGKHKEMPVGRHVKNSNLALVTGDFFRNNENGFPSAFIVSQPAIADGMNDVNIFVDTTLDGVGNESQCDAQLPTSEGSCTLRAAVSLCESLLRAGSGSGAQTCSVHLPVISNIEMDPALGELSLQGALLNGTLSIIGNGCHISPNASANVATAMRFLHISGGENFTFHVLDLSLSQFGAETVDGGAVLMENMWSQKQSSVGDVAFISNRGLRGGALFVNQSSHVTIASCTFTNNTAFVGGGGVYVDEGNSLMVFTSCSFLRNTALLNQSNGGGVYVGNGNEGVIVNSCSFVGNRAAGGGGGMYVESNNINMVLSPCNFTQNYAAFNGGGLYVGGHNHNMAISSCIFYENFAADDGGGVHVNWNNSHVRLSFSNFSKNRALDDGGGLRISSFNDDMTLTSCLFEQNKASDQGGGVFVGRGNDLLSFSFCTFDYNFSPRGGGGIYVDAENVGMAVASCSFLRNLGGIVKGGGGMFFGAENDYATLSSCSFNNNSAKSGGGLYVDEGNHNVVLSACSFLHNTASEDGGGVFSDDNNDFMTFVFCSFEHNTAQDDGGGVVIAFNNDGLTFSSCTFSNNVAVGEQGLNNGGGIFFGGNNDNIALTLCDFTLNTAGHGGGGVTVSTSNRNMSFVACNFVQNTALKHGGGLFVDTANSDLFLFSCNFSHNTAVDEGGGLHVDELNQQTTLTSCIFFMNVAVESGGGMAVGGNNRNTSLTMCDFTLNTADFNGGGIDVDQYNHGLVLHRCSFGRNTAKINGGGLNVADDNNALVFSFCSFGMNYAGGRGGGMHVGTFNDGTTIFSSTFESNYALGDGGGLYIDNSNNQMAISLCNFTRNNASEFGGGGYVTRNNEFLTFSYCVWLENFADMSGGGLFVLESNKRLSIISCSFASNTAGQDGGGMHVDRSNVDMKVNNSTFEQNFAPRFGGGLSVGIGNSLMYLTFCTFALNSASHDGGGLQVGSDNSDMTLESCIFEQNNASEGGGIHIGSDNTDIELSFCSLSRNIATGSGGGMYVHFDNHAMTLSFCLFTLNIAGVYGGGIHVESSNWDMHVVNTSFTSNRGSGNGGALSTSFYNYGMVVSDSVFNHNSAGLTGGAINSALQGDGFVLKQSSFMNNTADLYGGSIYIGMSHESVFLQHVSVRGSFAESGGGIFIAQLSDVRLESCRISQNRATFGGGLVSLASGLSILASILDSNVATDACGGLCVDNAVEYFQLVKSAVVRNVAGESSGGLQLRNCGNVTITSCDFLQNIAGGSGGALSLSESHGVYVRNSSFVNNSAALGGAACANSVSDVSFFHTQWQENQASDNGGALYLADSFEVGVNVSAFNDNVALAGGGSAVFVRASSLSVAYNTFRNNVATGGGTLFWEHTSGMGEPAGLRTAGNEFGASNEAGYGPMWATEADHIAILDSDGVYTIVDYDEYAPYVVVSLQDKYDQMVLTDSYTLATVAIPASENSSCNNEAGFITGSTTISFVNGLANFTTLDPLCAPNHSLMLNVKASLEYVSDETSFSYFFRVCARGEYFEERICNPCEVGSYSFTDPKNLALSEITRDLMCNPCPEEAVYCYKDIMELKRGHWRSDEDSTNILECPWDLESCRGGEVTGDESCGTEYHGPLCAVCESDHHFVTSSNKCEPCDDTSSFFDPFTLSLMCLVIISVVLAIYTRKKIVREEKVYSVDHLIALFLLRMNVYNKDTYTEKKATRFHDIHLSKARAVQSCVVYFTFYQIVSTIPFILAGVDFPDVYDHLMSAVSVLNLSINQESVVNCSSSAQYDYVTRLVVGTIYPIIIAILIGMCCNAHLWYLHRNSVSDSRDIELRKRNISLGYKGTVLLLSFLVLPSVSVTIFRTFSCQNVGSGDEEDIYMTADYSVSCTSARYLFAFWWATMMIFVYPIGIPLSYFCILNTSKAKIKSGNVEMELVYKLCRNYTVQCWYWEVVDTMYRLSVTGFLVLFRTTSDTIFAGMMLSLAYLKALQVKKPFIDPELNLIKETSIWQIYFVFLIALMIQIDEIDRMVLTMALMFVFFANIIIFVGKWLAHCLEPLVSKSQSVDDSGVEVMDLSLTSSSKKGDDDHSVVARNTAQSPLHHETAMQLGP